MKYIIFICAMILLWASPCEAQNSTNPRLRNFRYGTGQASWWEQPTQRPPQQVIIQRQYIPYYPPNYYYRPYYNPFQYPIIYINGRPVIMRPQSNGIFFQFRF